ncbi:sensor histidine kinase [Paenibacillus sp. MMS20-IR301]|uniref:sensor histidine kinase n=1 Tax=Paenibacillus sp. MMS20-IR301 TaxID=2895946 RepID=UPI0028E447A6|nr:sensor histidine kinase [Paenibacillus sp. MMS20-IR301]WNS46667.1 sensor histidine kinase [Paenibacillus sp. MMS20-IR301]
MQLWNQFRYRLSGIRTTLLLSYLVIIFSCIAMVGVASYYISYTSMLEKVETASFQIVRQIENNMDNDMHNKRNLLLSPYYNQQYIDDINAYASLGSESRFVINQSFEDLYLKTFNTTPITDFVRFRIYFSTGELLSSSDNSLPGKPADVQKEPWFRETVSKDGRVNFISTPGQELNAAAPPVAYSTAILIRDFANRDQFIVVRADYSDGLFRSIARNAELTAGSKFLVLNESNSPVYVSGGETAREGGRMEAILPRMQGEQGTFWFSEDGRKYFISYTRSDYSGWKTVLLTPKKEIISPLNPIKTAVMYIGAFAFLITFLLSILLGRKITKPILDLHKSVNRIKRGDFSAGLDVNRNDEIGRIAMNFNAMRNELQLLIENKYIYQIKLQEAELAMLYSQINPHFLYNTLDSIKAMADYYSVGEISEMAQSLADMFRYNIKNSDEIVTLREELEQIEAYIRIQSFRFEGKFQYKVEVEEELYTYPLLKMTLQPLVENAVFHGIEPMREQASITITATRCPGGVQLSVSDTGVGIGGERLETIRAALVRPVYQEQALSLASGTGIGIRNVYARYAIRYGAGMDFEIASTQGQGTVVTLILREAGTGKSK